MKLFSKRYSPENLGKSTDDDRILFSSKLRTRLIKEVQFIVGSDVFIERFMSVEDQKEDKFYLYDKFMEDLSVHELGYDLTRAFNHSLEFINDPPNDFYLLDLFELIIVFAKNDKRSEVVKRLKRILEEENGDFTINEFVFVSKKETGLKAIIPLLKNPELKEKLEALYINIQEKPNYQSLARISADILQYLFSSPVGKKGTKSYSESLCYKVASKWTETKNVQALSELLSEQVKQAKNMINEISNIRHTDKSTIPVEGFSFYKLITYNNLSIIELVIQSLPEEYIMSKDPEQLKNDYIQDYGINKNDKWVVRKPEEDEEVAPDDIPF